MNNVLNNLPLILKTFYELHQYFCCYVISFVMCHMSMILVCVFFYYAELNIAILIQSKNLFDVHDHLHDNCVFVFQH